MSEQRARPQRKSRPAESLRTNEDFAQRASDNARRAASSIRDGALHLLDRQVESGATYVGFAASAVRSAADNLEPNVPQLAGLVSAAADRLEDYAEGASSMTAQDVWDEVSRVTRRQPALVFGLAALAGYLAYRSIQSSRQSAYEGSGAEEREREDA